MTAPKPVALIIMDGFGLRNTEVGNAVAQANKPNYDRYFLLLASYGQGFFCMCNYIFKKNEKGSCRLTPVTAFSCDSYSPCGGVFSST